jgi:hypothetical protein
MIDFELSHVAHARTLDGLLATVGAIAYALVGGPLVVVGGVGVGLALIAYRRRHQAPSAGGLRLRAGR